MAEGLAARRAVLALLEGVLAKGQSLAEMGAEVKGSPLAELSVGDRARAQRLATTVLRQAEPIDRMLGGFLHKEPPLGALNILRMAVVELAERITRFAKLSFAGGGVGARLQSSTPETPSFEVKKSVPLTFVRLVGSEPLAPGRIP